MLKNDTIYHGLGKGKSIIPRKHLVSYSNVRWAPLRLTSPMSRLSMKQFVYIDDKENIKLLHSDPRWIPLQRANDAASVSKTASRHT